MTFREEVVMGLARRATLGAFLLISLTVFGGTASASPSLTPNGWVGACNMNASWPTLSPGQAVGIQGTVAFDGDGGGMENAMTVNQGQNTNGNDGMFNATAVSGGQVC
jgi:hypothetical protein